MSDYKENAEYVREFLDDQDWHYEMEDHGNVTSFVGDVGGMKGPYKSLRFFVLACEDEVRNYVALPCNAKAKLPEVAEFIIRANSNIKFGAFGMDYDDGSVEFHLAFPAETVRADKTALGALIMLPISTMDSFSKGFVEVMMDLSTPAEAVAACIED